MSGIDVRKYRALIGELAALVRLARTALGGATAALMEPGGASDGVPAAEKALAELRGRVEDDAATTSAEPSAVVVGVHVGTAVEGLGRLAERLLQVAWSRRDSEPLPERVGVPLRGLADTALALLTRSAAVLEDGGAVGVADLLSDLHDVARRQRLLYELLLLDPSPVASGEAADVALLSCYYQQCAEHAAAIARHAVLFGRGRT
ncbi:hypothetical protein LN042_12065 [Kitasatospora sp. RB6PN24]|uniref:hypothetical protein n=1 Tax=Kitasatospora humi TaxID=2893891 RepID=UPI001E3EBF0F|nr:hypothetical protein [Kitasatospora humi]MCC9307820.1 hypothetical protein [Kitasatospora humi]